MANSKNGFHNLKFGQPANTDAPWQSLHGRGPVDPRKKAREDKEFERRYIDLAEMTAACIDDPADG